jgi:hypothetical protein
LRNKYRDVEQHTYRYTVDNFHPFLQFIPSKAQNLHINQWGFRGDEITKQKSKNTYRVFLLGGSTVFNSGVIYEKNVSKRLEEMLSQKYPEKKIEVINAGVDGYTSEHSLIQYLFYIKDFSPDMIIMWHGINDWYYSCTPKQYAYTSYKSDYSHHLGADAQMVFAHFQPSPLLSFHSVLVDQIGIFLKDNLYSDITTKIKQAMDSFEGMSLDSIDFFTRNTQALYGFPRRREKDGEEFLCFDALAAASLPDLAEGKPSEARMPSIVAYGGAVSPDDRTLSDSANAWNREQEQNGSKPLQIMHVDFHQAFSAHSHLVASPPSHEDF